MSNKTYILQKDLPTLKEGAEFTWDSCRMKYRSGDYTYKAEIVHWNTDWFKLKDECKPTIAGVVVSESNSTVSVYFHNANSLVLSYSKEKFAEILLEEQKKTETK